MKAYLQNAAMPCGSQTAQREWPETRNAESPPEVVQRSEARGRVALQNREAQFEVRERRLVVLPKNVARKYGDRHHFCHLLAHAVAPQLRNQLIKRQQ